MGNVRTDLVKNVAKELVRKFPDTFTDDFELNKTAVDTLTDVSSKKMRNKIAGYVTRIVNKSLSLDGGFKET